MATPALNALLDDLEDAGTIDDPAEVLAGFAAWAEEGGRALYPHQEAAAEEIFAGNHVIAATPTGSGKSLIALAAHLYALARDERSYYTAPLKALVSEKFFDLVDVFGAHNVGMVTGDVSLNADAPIICCTAEILANQALREGADLDAGVVIMDEFHFYGDPQRGWAWQVPLLELTRTQMVLMSATLGDVTKLTADLKRRTGRDVSVIDNAVRPVPLDFAYTVEDTPRMLARLISQGRWPIYLVHFSQKEALARAQVLANTAIVSREQRDKVAAAIKGFAFGRGFGQILKKLLLAGVGVHHAGMLPRYRRLVEQLTQRGLLAVISGTDTLGVGINVPIRTVVLTSLVKFDGRRMRHLSAREFHQIAGRAGRAGFDTVGFVEVQAPEHEIENAKAEAKAANAGKRAPKKKKSAGGEISWTESTFTRLAESQPEALRSQFRLTHAMVLNVLAGGRDAAEHLVWLARNNDDPPAECNPHLRQLGDIYHSMRIAEVVRHVPSGEAGPTGRLELVADLPEDFALNQPLSPFALAALDLLDPDSPEYPLDVVSVIEATLDDPTPLLLAQRKIARDAAYQRLRADRVPYDQRQEELDAITWPMPLDDLLQPAFTTYRRTNPWVSGLEISPKSVVRDMIENADTFTSLIQRLDLARSEGVILRYLTDAYRALRQVLPDEVKTEEIEAIIEWLGDLVRSVDSSLLDEWNALAAGHRATGDASPTSEEHAFGADINGEVPFGTNRYQLIREIRNATFARVELIARDDVDGLADLHDPGWDADAWDDALGDLYDEYEWVATDQPARSPGYVTIIERPGAADFANAGISESDPVVERGEKGEVWLVSQRLVDSQSDAPWQLLALVDVSASRAVGYAVVHTLSLGPVTGF
ncbi:MAG: DUF3516 domain-containing protein [Actinomycetaceae bacterium]|nr:DUF3516 domain-containing protein [Actinomycetaceae bacterium]MDU0970261.1 DUF3516 domain-containing protein [Actinomycetaceae bacterium]